jgi:hypothetical protein
MSQLIAYHNDPTLKARLIAELHKHREADAIAKGFYSEYASNAVEFRGCAIGCSLHSLGHASYDDHEAYEPLLGIPMALAYLEDKIFEGLPVDQARDWPLQFAEAIQVGTDLTPVADLMILFVLADEHFGCLQYANDPRARQCRL